MRFKTRLGLREKAKSSTGVIGIRVAVKLISTNEPVLQVILFRNFYVTPQCKEEGTVLFRTVCGMRKPPRQPLWSLKSAT